MAHVGYKGSTPALADVMGGHVQIMFDAVTAKAREPHWYVEGTVPDTLDGRFDMIAAVLTLLLILSIVIKNPGAKQTRAVKAVRARARV